MISPASHRLKPTCCHRCAVVPEYPDIGDPNRSICSRLADATAYAMAVSKPPYVTIEDNSGEMLTLPRRDDLFAIGTQQTKGSSVVHPGCFPFTNETVTLPGVTTHHGA